MIIFKLSFIIKLKVHIINIAPRRINHFSLASEKNMREVGNALKINYNTKSNLLYLKWGYF